jgi:predicted membrane-bound dolichyl-phosphate-mannose-protein mannosyltransferase
MKQPFFCILFMFWVQLCFSQTYDNLQKLGAVSQNVYYSEDAKERALKIAENITNAEKYFQQQFDVKPNYTLLVLSPSDWKKYAHPQAI